MFKKTLGAIVAAAMFVGLGGFAAPTSASAQTIHSPPPMRMHTPPRFTNQPPRWDGGHRGGWDRGHRGGWSGPPPHRPRHWRGDGYWRGGVWIAPPVVYGYTSRCWVVKKRIAYRDRWGDWHHRWVPRRVCR